MRRLCATALLCAWGLCATAVEKSPTIVSIDGAKYYVHTVQPGETLYAIAKAYGVGEGIIVENNPSAASGLRAAEHLKIPFTARDKKPTPERKLRKTFDFHFVTKGETLYAISRQYGIPIPTIIEDNPDLDPIRLSLGQRILIRRKEIGSESEAATQEQWEEYRTSLSNVAEKGFDYHIVQPGETIYSLSRRFGTSEEELSRLNGGLQAAELKAGAMIKVPGDENAPEHTADSDEETDATQETENDRIEEIEFRALPAGKTLNVALLLPLTTQPGSAANASYQEFYQGFLLGLDSVKRRGYSVHVDLYDTHRDSARVRELAECDASFGEAGLIVGPVYEEELYPVIRQAERKGIPVVSPLAQVSRTNSDVLFQMAPDPTAKYTKVAELFNPDKQVTLIYTAQTDKEFEAEILALLGDREYMRHTYKYEHPSAAKTNSPSDLTPLLENDKDNVFVIMSDNEVDVDRILAALASADTSLTSRRRTAPQFVVLGNARWNRYPNLDRSMFFKDRVIFISTYHAKRDSQAVVEFDKSYIRAFGALPTLYSYRGYDTALLFCPAMFGDIEYDMEGRRYTPLQTSYVFGQGEDTHTHVNRNWTRVDYNPDFTITVE